MTFPEAVALLEHWYVHGGTGCAGRGCEMRVLPDVTTFAFRVWHGQNPECTLTFGAQREPAMVELGLTDWIRRVHAYEDGRRVMTADGS